jgi:hypothetical protein
VQARATGVVTLYRPVVSPGDLLVAAGRDLTLATGAQVTGREVVLSTGEDLVNVVGNSAVAAATRWIVYAPTPDDVPDPGLPSGNPAVWNATLDSLVPTAIPAGNRYAFEWAPDVTVRADDTSKDFDTAFTAGVPTPLTATVTAPLHPGVPGLFSADTGTVYTGVPVLSSAGAAHDAPERAAGPYPIDVSVAGMASPLRYDIEPVGGRLTVNDTTPPTVTPSFSGTAGANGWYTSDVTVSWTVDDTGTEPAAVTGCAPTTVVTDQDTAVTCTGSSLGGQTTVTVPVKRDASPPTMSIDGLLPGGGTYVPGSWTDGDVAITYTCGFGIAGPGSGPVNTTASTSGDYGGTCTDAAGQATSVPFLVSVDKLDPTVGTVTATRASGAAYSAGDWSNEDVVVTWTCSDTGGSGAVAPTPVTRSSTGTVTPVCRDTAGNETSGDAVEVNIDTAAPTGNVALTLPDGSPYATGSWSRVPVTASFTCADAGGSGLLVLGGSITLPDSQPVTFFCSDRAGNSTALPAQALVDGTPPSLGPVQLVTAAGLPYTAGSWTDQDVTVSWTCGDTGGSGLDPTAATGETRTTSGTVTPSCSDLAGNTATGSAVDVRIDRVAPVVAGIADISVTTATTSSPVSWPTPAVTDDQGTAAPVSCDPASGSTFPLGVTTVTCSSTDAAGNRGSTTFTVTVTAVSATATFDAPLDRAPVMNVAKLGRVIPVKAVVTNGGAPVTGASGQPVHLSVASGVSCTVGGTTDAMESYAVGASNAGNLLRWDATAQRWMYNLDTSAFAMKANACYRVSVFYGGTVTGDRATGGVLAGWFFVQTKK